jgi:hypothetical protein
MLVRKGVWERTRSEILGMDENIIIKLIFKDLHGRETTAFHINRRLAV